MKKHGLFLFLMAALNLYAQDVIVNPPLDVVPDGTRTLKPDAPTGAIVPAKIDPVDGQLKLESKHDSKPVEQANPVGQDSVQGKNEKQNAEAAISIPPRVFNPASIYPLEKYVQFSFGYLNSKWEKADPSLDNGSTLTDFRIVSDMSKRNQFGFAVELIHDNSNESVPENIRVLQYRLFIDHHQPLFNEKLDWMAGLALSMGDYSIRKLNLNASGEEVYHQLDSGTIYGLIPSAGLRFYLGQRNSIDVGLEYHFYISKPQSFIGGLAFVPRFSFVF